MTANELPPIPATVARHRALTVLRLLANHLEGSANEALL